MQLYRLHNILFVILLRLTLNDMKKAIGAQSVLRTVSILGTCASRISKGPDADWILCIAYTGQLKGRNKSESGASK